jgi:hypothetical protein
MGKPEQLTVINEAIGPFDTLIRRREDILMPRFCKGGRSLWQIIVTDRKLSNGEKMSAKQAT